MSHAPRYRDVETRDWDDPDDPRPRSDSGAFDLKKASLFLDLVDRHLLRSPHHMDPRHLREMVDLRFDVDLVVHRCPGRDLLFFTCGG